MKILLCMINSKYVHSSLAPWCLRAGVAAYCPENIVSKVFESTINENSDDVCNRILSEKADVIGFCCYIWNIEYVKNIALMISELTDSVIVFGGPEVSFNQGEILDECEYVDYVLSGEGEETFADLCNCIYVNTDIENVKGLSYRKNGSNVISSPYYSSSEPVSPYCEEYLKSLKGRIAYIEASRGCPFSCGFCLSGNCGELIFYDIERVKSEIILLANSTAKTIKFVDRTFNAKEDRANEILTFIFDNYGDAIPDDVCFHFEIAGDILRESTMEIMKKLPSGLIQLEVGLQTFNEETLKRVNRKPDTKKLVENIKKLLSFGNMHIHIDLIAGLPGEDLKSFALSFDRAYFLYPNMLQLGFLKLLYGSALRRDSDNFGCVYSDKPPYEVIKTDCLSPNDIKTVHLAEDALERMYNSGRFKFTLEYILKETKINPFKLFCMIGENTKNYDNISLDDYLCAVYNFLSGMCDKSVLRDRMIIDRILSNSSGVIPECLRIEDKKLKQVKKYIRENLHIGGKMSCAILYSEGKIVFCKYDAPDVISGNYELNYIKTEEIFGE